MSLATVHNKIAQTLTRPNVILLSLIIGVAVFLRFFMLAGTPPGLYPDEAVNGINTLQVLEEHAIKVFYPENFGREGLFMNIQAIFVWLFGTEAWTLRFASGLFGVGTVLGIYFLGKELFRNELSAPFTARSDPPSSGLQAMERAGVFSRYIPNDFFRHSRPIWLGLLASFFLATSFWHINFSRIGFRAIMSPFWSIWGFYFILLAFRRLREQAPLARTLGYSLLGGLFFGMGFNSYISYRVMPALLLVAFIYQILKRKEVMGGLWLHFGVIAAGCVLVILPLAAYFIQNPQDFLGRTSQVSILSSANPAREFALNIIKTAGMFNVAGDFNQRHNIAGEPELYWPIGIFLLVGLWQGLLRIVKPGGKDRFPVIFLFGWLLLALLPVVASNEGIPHALRAILAIRPVFLFTALGAMASYEFLVAEISAHPAIRTVPSLNLIHTFSIIFVALLVLEAYTAYFLNWAMDPKTAEAFNKPVTDYAYDLRALPNELKKYVIIPDGDMGINVVQFLTDTYTDKKQKEHNLYYYTPDQIKKLTKQELEGIYVSQIP